MRKLLVLGLDGLSHALFGQLCSFVPWLDAQLSRSLLLELKAAPAISANAVWSEILSGQSWHALGCCGYARPGAQIDQPVIVTEEGCGKSFKLLADSESGSLSPERFALVANVPVVLPANDRLWLSDGSLPLEFVVYPESLRAITPLASYNPRPFNLALAHLSDLEEAVTKCLAVERERLDCVDNLLSQYSCRLCILRLSFLDILSHLIGHDFLFGQKLKFWPAIELFLTHLNNMLCRIHENLGDDVAVAVVSGYGHDQCLATANLNEMLRREELCHFTKTVDSNISKRKAVLQMLRSQSRRQWAVEEPELGSLIHEQTRAYSPGQGAIYANRLRRFSRGIVLEENLPDLITEIESVVRRHLAECISSTPLIWKSSSQVNLPDEGQAPELMVYCRGVEFIDSGIRATDCNEHPWSTHTDDGFALIEQDAIGAPPTVLKPHELTVRLQKLISR